MVRVDNNSHDDVKTYLREISGDKVKILFNDVNYGFSYAVNQGVANAPADADIVLMNNDARFEIGSIKRLQEIAYEATDIAISVPRQIVPAKTEDINLHVPYADFNQACDVSLSVHHNNIDSLKLFHIGRKIDLNFAPFFCVYIKREVWDACEGLDYENGRHYRSDRIMCDFVKQMLNMRIVYTSDAIVHHAAQVATNELSRNGGNSSEHRMMLIKNIWPDDLVGKLKIRKRPWTDN